MLHHDQLLVEAFLSSRNQYSVDRVIADPELNALFMQACQDRGLTSTASELNWRLLNIRKRGELITDDSSKRTVVKNQDEYRFAAEMTVRFLERRDETSLDGILCEPESAAEFDSLCKKIAPGFSSFEYRWAALALRKSRKLSPEILARVAPPISVKSFVVRSLDVKEIPRAQGLYLFHDRNQLLYIGEAENLYKRINKHLEHSDNKGLARWMWEHEDAFLRLEVQVLEEQTTTRVRRALELELIRSRNPVFNVKR